MIGAESLLLPLTPPDEAIGGKEQEVQQPARCQEKEEGRLMDSPTSDCAASGMELKSTQRQSEVDASCVAAVPPTSSLVWWYQPWGNYCTTLDFFCVGCQTG